MTIGLVLLLLTGVVCIEAVTEDGWGPFKPTPTQLKIPKGWPKPTGVFDKNPLTNEGFELGRKLFYDANLSVDSSISCAACHQQFAAFSTYDHDISHGVNNTFTERNAPALFNLAWMKEFHWDGGINHLEVQPLAPLTNHNEMGNTLTNILTYLKNDTGYRRMFKAAFGDPAINSQRFLKALAQFTGSMVSCNSKYDKVMRGEDTFNLYESRGYTLFKKNCSTCHKEPLFTDNSYRNNGKALNRFNDIGRQKVTGKSEDSLKFKVPSLRNVQVTLPYMHDGSMSGLSTVIEHYNSGIISNQPTLDPLLRNKIAMTKMEKYDLMFFLFTLTDSSYLKDARYSGNKIDVHSLHK